MYCNSSSWKDLWPPRLGPSNFAIFHRRELISSSQYVAVGREEKVDTCSWPAFSFFCLDRALGSAVGLIRIDCFLETGQEEGRD